MKMKKRRAQREASAPTWVDLLVLALLGAMICFGWFYFRARSQAADPNVAIEYLLLVSGADTTYFGADGDPSVLIPIGCSVKVANGTSSLGTVTAVRSEGHVEPKAEQGEVIFAQNPHRVDLYIEVRGDAVAKKGDGLRIRDVRIAAGGTGDFRIGGFMASAARVISVTKEGAT